MKNLIDLLLHSKLCSVTHSAVLNIFSKKKKNHRETQLMMVQNAYQKLQGYGRKQASALLSTQNNGTFLTQDSSDSNHLFTVSIKAETHTKNVHIQIDETSSFLQTEPKNVDHFPHFNSVSVHYVILRSKCSCVPPFGPLKSFHLPLSPNLKHKLHLRSGNKGEVGQIFLYTTSDTTIHELEDFDLCWVLEWR
uniref:SH2 domain-containing protein n=1 Tax=Fundulus heteroclitus TaxID=8078 RepID=A0A3Q2P6E0_FUNHE